MLWPLGFVATPKFGSKLVTIFGKQQILQTILSTSMTFAFNQLGKASVLFEISILQISMVNENWLEKWGVREIGVKMNC